MTIPPIVLAAIDRAIQAGEHSPIEQWSGTVCGLCGKWMCRGAYWVNEQGVRMCRDCAPKDKQDRKV